MPNLTWYGSPNFTPGRTDVEFIVIHWMDGYLAGADATFQNTVRQTSAHYGVEDDTIHQYVDEANTAWHAGNFDANTRSIGIEHSAMPGRPASDATYASTIWLIIGICQRYGLDPAVAILPHQHFTSTDCPGTMDLPRIIAGVQAALGGTSAQSGTITHISTDDFTEAEMSEALDLLHLLRDRQLENHLVTQQKLDSNHLVAMQKADSNHALEQGSLDRAPAAVWNQSVGSGNAAGVLNHIDATVGKASAATPALDLEALATSVASKINAAQADSFVAAFRNQFNK